MSLITELRKELSKIKGLSEEKSRFSKRVAFFVGEREIAHFHNNNEIDVRITRQEIKKLKNKINEDNRYHQRSPSSDWIEFKFRRAADVPEALRLIKLAIKSGNPSSHK